MSAVHHHHWHDFDRYHWRDTLLRLAVAVLFIIVVHAAAVYIALFWRMVEAGDQAPPAAVMIELAPMAVSEASQEDLTPGPQMVQSPESVPDAPDIPEEAAPPPEPEVVEQVIEKMPELDPSPVEAEVVLPKPQPEKKEPLPRPKKVERPKKDAKPTRRREAPVNAAAPRSEAPQAETTAAPSAGSTAARSSSLADWRSRAFAHLSRYKRSQRGLIGRPGISISITAAGTVTSVSLVRSSGNPVLDEEAVAMARRASPFPPHPDGRAFTFTVSVDFTR